MCQDIIFNFHYFSIPAGSLRDFIVAVYKIIKLAIRAVYFKTFFCPFFCGHVYYLRKLPSC